MKIQVIWEKTSPTCRIEYFQQRHALLGCGDGEYGDGIAIGLAGDFGLLVG
jgi:hypothetical protein